MRRSMYLYAWDAVDTGIPVLLDRLRLNGITGVKVAAVYHTGKILLPRNPRRRVFVPENGVLYFRPSSDFRRTSGAHPPVSRFCERFDVLHEICVEAQRRHMDVDAWAVCLHNSAIGAAQPELLTVNAFGDSYPHSLCPMQPAVRSYLESLVHDLAGYPIRRLILEALYFVPYKHYSLFEIEGVPVGTVENTLLSLCFCAACRRTFPALEKIRDRVRGQLDQFFDTGMPLPDDAIGGSDMREVFEQRMEAVATLAGTLADIARKHGKGLAVIGWAPVRSDLFGVDLARLGRRVDAVDFAYYHPDPEALPGQLAEVRKAMPEACAIDLILRPSHPDTPTAANLLAKVASARSAGIADVSFYNYGILPNASLDWVHSVS